MVYLNDYWINLHNIWYSHSCSPQEELYYIKLYEHVIKHQYQVCLKNQSQAFFCVYQYANVSMLTR